MSGSLTDEQTPPILVLSGPSGSGKSTIVDRLVDMAPVRLMKAVSATTRPSRQGEVDGDDYYFLSAEEFERRRVNDEFIEVAEVHSSGFWYGTLKSELRRASELNAWVFLEIDVQGALNITQQFPEAVSIFLKAPSIEEYERRLKTRGTETEEVIQRRLETARKELLLAEKYRHQVVNNDLERAVQEIARILTEWETRQNAG